LADAAFEAAQVRSGMEEIRELRMEKGGRDENRFIRG
jgi:hypothetical protein